MDLMSTAQLLGNFGEFAGAIAVVVTLVYVALQVKQSREATIQNTKAVRSSIYESLNQTETAFSDFYAQHRLELAELQTLSERDELTAEQNILAGAFGNRAYRSLETVYLHHKNGMLDDDLLEARIRGFSVFIDLFPGLKKSFEFMRSGSGGFTEEFIRFIEEAIPSLRHVDS
ncbi:MAG: hypothetical protein ACR2PZ_00605 [Pseudomonadales bacterium]